MNGATRDPRVNAASDPSSRSMTTTGPSHHLLRSERKAAKSRARTLSLETRYSVAKSKTAASSVSARPGSLFICAQRRDTSSSVKHRVKRRAAPEDDRRPKGAAPCAACPLQPGVLGPFPHLQASYGHLAACTCTSDGALVGRSFRLSSVLNRIAVRRSLVVSSESTQFLAPNRNGVLTRNAPPACLTRRRSLGALSTTIARSAALMHGRSRPASVTSCCCALRSRSVVHPANTTRSTTASSNSRIGLSGWPKVRRTRK